MRPRLPGSYGARKGSELQTFPILALACEGMTEKLYARWLARGNILRIMPKDFSGVRGTVLIDNAARYAEGVRRNYSDVAITPGVLYDMEGTSSRAIGQAIRDAEYAKRIGVEMWINVPTIERWFLLHYKHFSPNRSERSARGELNRQLEQTRMPIYRKPGNTRFFNQLLPRTDIAVANCQNSHIPEMQRERVACICELVGYVRQTT